MDKASSSGDIYLYMNIAYRSFTFISLYIGNIIYLLVLRLDLPVVPVFLWGLYNKTCIDYYGGWIKPLADFMDPAPCL